MVSGIDFAGIIPGIVHVCGVRWMDFLCLAVAGVIVLRKRQPELERPFRVPGYPWLPALFALAALGITVSAVLSSPMHAVFGCVLVLSGLPLYVFFVARAKSGGTDTAPGAATE